MIEPANLKREEGLEFPFPSLPDMGFRTKGGQTLVEHDGNPMMSIHQDDDGSWSVVSLMTERESGRGSWLSRSLRICNGLYFAAQGAHAL